MPRWIPHIEIIRRGREPERDGLIGFNQAMEALFSYGGHNYSLMQQIGVPGSNQEVPEDFAGHVRLAYKSCGVVFACSLARMLLFSEARFQFRQIRKGRPGDLFGSSELRPLEKPWPGGTTGDLLSRAEQDVTTAGNFFAARRNGGIKRLRPDWVTIIMGSETDPETTAEDMDAEVIGYLFHPGGRASGRKPVPLLANEVAHYAPIPDPECHYRGMSWLTPVVNEILADKAATTHKLKFFENGASLSYVVELPETDPAKFKTWQDIFNEKHQGTANAYRTLFLGAGAKPHLVGADLKQLDFKATQGAGETRIAAAAGVPPVIVGLSEGLQAATYSNYGQARRRFADGTMRPLWRNFAGSMARIINVPGDSELWYNDSDIPFLKEDQKDATEILQMKASAMRQLLDGGFESKSVVDAVNSGDYTRLVHTGLFSVQLQPPGKVTPPPETPPAIATPPIVPKKAK